MSEEIRTTRSPMDDAIDAPYAPRRFWCRECQGDGCIMCEGTGDSAEWRSMTKEQRSAARG